MEANRKRVQVHMLPTDNEQQIGTNELWYLTGSKTIWKHQVQQHLYFTTDEEIKKGDWYLLGNTPRQSTGDLGKPDTKWLKIIASTDPKLTRPGKFHITKKFEYKLPQPSQAFIEKYCKVGGIDEVDVEYERSGDTIIARQTSPSKEMNIKAVSNIQLKLKVDSHNTITIHPIKDSWSKEEVIAACKEAFSCGVRLWEDWEEDDHKMWDNFVEENF